MSYGSDYGADNQAAEWEFKIVRSETGAFGQPDTLRQLIDEEAQAGWVMLEKFDNSRIRFKRPVAARERDAALPPGYDPYRTTYGMSGGLIAVIVVGMVLVLTVGIILAAIILAGN